jgi:hypothetical protein
VPQDYEFEVEITAVVRVRAESESQAREVVSSSALASPSAEEIRLANQAEFVMGKVATVVSVDFSINEDSIKRIELIASSSQDFGELAETSVRRSARRLSLVRGGLADDDIIEGG